jgi:hypothetical protein
MRKGLLLVALLSLVAALSVAQSNQIIDEVLAEEEGTFGHAAYLALLASGAVAPEATVEEVYAGLKWGRWNLSQKRVDDTVTLGEFSYLVMESLDISGGIMYGIAPGPRYAARELAYLDFFLGSGSPYRSVSGEEMLHVLGQALAYVEEGR